MKETLLALDPAVPQRDWLLDPAVMQRHFRDVFGERVGRLQTRRIKYRVGDSLRVVYRLPRPNRDDALVTVRTSPAGVRFWRFPCDRRLAQIDALLRPSADLGELLDGNWQRSRVVGYAPEKSVVVVCLAADETPVAYAKQYASSADAIRAFRLHADIWQSGRTRSRRLRVPRPIALSEQRHVVLSECARGTRLTDSAAVERERAMSLLGAATAELHAMQVPACAPRFTRLDRSGLIKAGEIIAAVRPSLVSDLSTLIANLAANPADDEHRVLLHGDVHLKNALANGEELWLIDLDQAASGPAAADIGSFLALLRSRAVARLLTRREAARCERQFLAGYQSVRTLPSNRTLRWYTAAALVAERAVRAISRVRRPILRNMEALLREARDVLEPGGSL